MSADIRAENQPYDDINITPMLDLAYVLLVTFIILTTASVQGVKVNSPQTRAANSLAKPQTKAITVTESGQMFLDTYPVTMPELEQRLRDLKAVNPSFPVVIKGDAKVNYEKVMAVLDLMGRLDITQLLVTICHPNEGLRGHRAIGALRDLLVLLNGALQIALDGFRLHGGPQRHVRTALLRQGPHRPHH